MGDSLRDILREGNVGSDLLRMGDFRRDVNSSIYK